MRSQYLTLLCILTFLSCAIGLVDAVVSYFQTSAVSETPYVADQWKKAGTDTEPKKYFEDRSSGDVPLPANEEQVRSLAIAQFAYSILTLIGAVLMFRLRRIGFWVYVAGIVVGFVLTVSMGGFGALNTSFGVFFSLIFAGLYWVNIKEMS